MKVEEIRELMQEMAQTGVAELQYEEGGVALHLCTKDAPVRSVKDEAVRPAGEEPVRSAEEEAVGPVKDEAVKKEAPSGEQTGKGQLVKSPLVGIFYTAPAPDQPAYVKAGDKVKKGQVLGLIEAMKLMNEVEAECEGTVTEILAENEQMVEYGQPLFRIG
ncbi:MAG: acetyl-CoA carboxylase biotin carboxyl carrier protein [Eubacteriales bacterium]|nr:acetyl-CoA carboxylase biotin carboxyl carrier protein [Eubacteriales bacterium]